ncbi:MAG: 4'-phosphopantetheinyl transferase family protein [Candidatus Hydrogenedentota bacterium]
MRTRKVVPAQPPREDCVVHVWRIGLDLPDGPLLSVCRDVLSAAERARADGQRNDKSRRRYVAAHAALHAILGRFIGVAPGGVRFEYGAFGKPHLFPTSRWSFSLAHSGNVALVTAARGRLVGVDVEQVRPAVRAVELAKRFFADDEAVAVAACSAGERAAAFARLWTLKEAVGKALGCGLRPSVVGRFVAPEVLYEDVVCRRFTRWPLTGAWTVHMLAPAGGYVGAVAGAGEGWELRHYAWEWDGAAFARLAASGVDQA